MLKVIDIGKVGLEVALAEQRSSCMAIADDAERSVREALDAVRTGGDAALIELTKKFDGVDISAGIRVEDEEMERAAGRVQKSLLSALERAADNIRAYHIAEKPRSWSMTDETGSLVGQKMTAVQRAGIYAPGGKASYPSSVLMNAIPALVAGVESIALCTPPGPDGRIADATLAAARVAGLTEVYRLGGSQAIAALAYGTESVPAVDVITGPGNLYVTLAKKLVYGIVGIDMLAGPSEVVIVADATAEPRFVAADLAAQAEHGGDSAAILVTDSRPLIEDVDRELVWLSPELIRAQFVSDSIARNGRAFLCPDMDAAMEVANGIAPEHLEIMTADDKKMFDAVRHAGAVFLGPNSPVALGDYMAGPNHTLPTGGTARFSSGLSVTHFMKRTSVIDYTAAGLKGVSRMIETIADAEGLEAHSRSVGLRLESGREG